jgi:hypothetical protein
MATESWSTAQNVLLILLLIGGYLIILVNRGIDFSNGKKFYGSEFDINFTTTMVFGSFIILAATGFLLKSSYDEETMKYLVFLGAILGIALNMIAIQFIKIRMNYATND